MLACEPDDPDACIVGGVLTGECKAVHPEGLTACSDPEDGPVCPPP